jgi:putative ABC transport system permease protein
MAGALALAVALAGAVALTLVAGTLRTSSAPDRYTTFWGSDQDLTVEQASGPPRVDELAGLHSVRRAEMATFVFAALLTRGDEGLDSFVFAGDPGGIGARIVAGRAADEHRPGEFVATRKLVETAGLHLGDQLRLVTITQATSDALGFDAPDPDGPAVTARLVGVIASPGEVEGAAAPLAVFPRSLLSVGDVGIAASEGGLILAPGATLHDVRAELDRLPDAEAFGLQTTQVVPSDVRDAVNTQVRGLAILALIVGFTVLSVLGQLLSRQFRLEASERRILRSLGYSPAQLVQEQAVRTAIPVGIGAAAAGTLAWLASGSFPVGFSRHVEPHPGRHLDLVAHAAGAVILVVAVVLWVGVSQLLDARVRAPRDRPGLVDRLVPSLPSVPATTALRFAFTPAGPIRTGRTSLVGLTAVFCVLFGALAFGANLEHLVDDPSTYALTFDVYLGQGGNDIGAAVEGGLEGNPDIGALTLFGTSTLVAGSRTLDVVGMRVVKGRRVPELLAGRLPAAVDEIALGPVAARHLGVGVGDRLSGRAAAGRRSLEVTGIALIPGVNGADVLGEVGLVSEAGLHGLDPDSAMSAAGIVIAPGARPGATARITKATGMETGPLDPPADIINLGRVRTIPNVVALSVGVLGVLSLGHLMVVGVRRRRRDFAVLRAIGAERAWVSRVVHWQATFTAAVVLLIAGPVGTLAGASLYRRFVTDLGARPSTIVPVGWTLALLAALLLLTNLAAAVAVRRLRRDEPAAVLAAG